MMSLELVVAAEQGCYHKANQARESFYVKRAGKLFRSFGKYNVNKCKWKRRDFSSAKYKTAVRKNHRLNRLCNQKWDVSRESFGDYADLFARRFSCVRQMYC
jgi:hypothetical protein